MPQSHIRDLDDQPRNGQQVCRDWYGRHMRYDESGDWRRQRNGHVSLRLCNVRDGREWTRHILTYSHLTSLCCRDVDPFENTSQGTWSRRKASLSSVTSLSQPRNRLLLSVSLRLSTRIVVPSFVIPLSVVRTKSRVVIVFRNL